MEKMRFDIHIQAPPEKVWDAVVGEREFREWTRPFNAESRYEGAWGKGEQIRFLGTNDNGETEGMLAEIAESRRPSFLSIRHVGVIRGSADDARRETATDWGPAYENYTLTPTAEGTRFTVEVDTEEEYVQMFSDMWPRALAALKNVAER